MDGRGWSTESEATKAGEPIRRELSGEFSARYARLCACEPRLLTCGRLERAWSALSPSRLFPLPTLRSARPFSLLSHLRSLLHWQPSAALRSGPRSRACLRICPVIYRTSRRVARPHPPVSAHPCCPCLAKSH